MTWEVRYKYEDGYVGCNQSLNFRAAGFDDAVKKVYVAIQLINDHPQDKVTIFELKEAD